MDEDMEIYEGQCERQGKLVKSKTRTTAQLVNNSELARAKLEISRSRLANQVIDTLNSHPENTWVVDQRDGGKHDLRNAIVNVVTSMIVHLISMNQMEA